MELILCWHICGLILVALAGQMSFAQNCFTGNAPVQVIALVSYNRTIEILNDPLDYHDNMKCKWRVIIQDNLDYRFGGYVIKVIFNDFELQPEQASSVPSCVYDTLKFYDGYSESSPLLGSYCGTVHPEVIYSTGSFLYITLRTGATDFSRRFRISVSVVRAEKASGICHPSRGNGNAIIVQGHYGTIFTPDYPVPYQDDTTCVWRLYVADGDRVKLTFVEFELGQSVINTKYSFCDVKSGMDYVEIRDGEWSTHKLLGSYCGKKTPFNVYSSGSHMYIKFRANHDGVRANRGFKAHFEPVKQLYSAEQCLPGNKKNLELRLTGSSGTLQSPEYYPPELLCEWLITVPEGKKVELSFERIELDFATVEYGCSDYVQIHDGDSSESSAIDNFCGNVIPKPVTSSGRHMYVRFQADSEYDTPRRGFKATFKAVKEPQTSKGHHYAALWIAVGSIVGVIVLIIMVCCVVQHVKRKQTPNRAADVAIPIPTTTASASRSTQPGVIHELHQPAGNTFSSPSVGYAPVPTNPPPPEYPYPLEPPPPYPGKEGEPQYPPPGQSYPWQQSSGSAPVPESP